MRKLFYRKYLEILVRQSVILHSLGTLRISQGAFFVGSSTVSLRPCLSSQDSRLGPVSWNAASWNAALASDFFRPLVARRILTACQSFFALCDFLLVVKIFDCVALRCGGGLSRILLESDWNR